MQDLHAVGAIDKATMRDFDVGCLTEVEDFAPEAIRQIREQAHMSQATFALALNVSKMLVSKWERGEVRPSGRPSSSLLSPTPKGSTRSSSFTGGPDGQAGRIRRHHHGHRSRAAARADGRGAEQKCGHDGGSYPTSRATRGAHALP